MAKKTFLKSPQTSLNILQDLAFLLDQDYLAYSTAVTTGKN